MALSQRHWFHRILYRLSRLNSNHQRLFFCINSGRSGSEYLAGLLGSTNEVTSYHEAEPTMTGKYLHMINDATYTDSFQKRQIKVKMIKKIIRGFPLAEIYCETNHMFIKTFFDVVLEAFKKVEVIILRRELALMLKSFIELNYFSWQNKIWPDWMSSPNATTAAVPCIASDKEMDQYDRCIAYLVDIEARSERFKREYPWVKSHEIRLEALNNYGNVEKLFRDLRITPTNKTREIVGQVVNIREKRKKDFDNPTELEYCRERIAIYIKKSKSLGMSLPESLALDRYKECY